MSTFRGFFERYTETLRAHQEKVEKLGENNDLYSNIIVQKAEKYIETQPLQKKVEFNALLTLVQHSERQLKKINSYFGDYKWCSYYTSKAEPFLIELIDKPDVYTCMKD